MEKSWASSDHARRTMRANKRRDTKPELVLRSILHSRGLRFRVDCSPMKGVRPRADIVFTKVKIAVFVDGCFWHGCSEHFIMPKTNTDYWSTKISRNAARDTSVNRTLKDAGWTVMRVWEHEDSNVAADRIETAWRQAAR
ncbi:very short patch repair endonuclease [Brevibacterium casei]|nr:very short patch repair endonuclease [Brevibacterium casei]